MALTRIQPSGVDQTLDYSVHKLTVSGVDVLGYAQSAFLQANTVYTYANTLSPVDSFARTQANAAFIQANSVYNYANTLSPTDTWARIQANAAYTKANTGGAAFGTIAVSGGTTANIVAASSNTLITFIPSFGVTMNLNSTNQTIAVGILGGVQGTSLDWGSITDSTITTSLDFGSTV
jgi:hypothetical protein